MKKIRLTENELVSLIEKVVNETELLNEYWKISKGSCCKCSKVSSEPGAELEFEEESCRCGYAKNRCDTKMVAKQAGGMKKMSKSQGMRNESYKQGYRDALREMRNKSRINEALTDAEKRCRDAHGSPPPYTVKNADGATIGCIKSKESNMVNPGGNKRDSVGSKSARVSRRG